MTRYLPDFPPARGAKSFAGADGGNSGCFPPGKDAGRRNESYDGLLFPPEQCFNGVFDIRERDLFKIFSRKYFWGGVATVGEA
jgi:hypothetical protein